MLLVWVQTFGSGQEVISFVGENPTEEDINMFWGDPDETKRFIRAEVHEGSKHIERILDVENGWDLTATLWARKLITSALADHHG